MKKFFKLFVTIWILTAACSLYAQSDSASFLIRFKGGYADYGTSNGVSSLGSANSANTAWNLDLSVGWKINKAWEAGFGIEYQKQKSDAYSEIYLPNQWYAVQLTKTDINLFLGKIYIAWHLRLFNRIYFIPDMALYYGKADGKQEVATAYRKHLSSDELELGEVYFSSTLGIQDISYDYLALKFAPAFAFFITKHFAMNLEIGSFGFNMIDDEWNWTANINPTYWKLGVIFAF